MTDMNSPDCSLLDDWHICEPDQSKLTISQTDLDEETVKLNDEQAIDFSTTRPDQQSTEKITEQDISEISDSMKQSNISTPELNNTNIQGILTDTKGGIESSRAVNTASDHQEYTKVDDILAMLKEKKMDITLLKNRNPFDLSDRKNNTIFSSIQARKLEANYVKETQLKTEFYREEIDRIHIEPRFDLKKLVENNQTDVQLMLDTLKSNKKTFFDNLNSDD